MDEAAMKSESKAIADDGLPNFHTKSLNMDLSSETLDHPFFDHKARRSLKEEGQDREL